MGKKYVGIAYKLDNDNEFVDCKIVVKDFENIQKWFKGWAENSGHEDDFSKENTNVDISWEENGGDDEYKLCIVDNWDDDKQVSKFHNILRKWGEYACELCQEREDANECFQLLVFNNNEECTEIYNVLNDKDFVHFEDGEYEHDLFLYDEDSERYLFKKIDELVKKEIGTMSKKEGLTKKSKKEIKFVGIMYDLLDDNGELHAECEIKLFEDFESTKKWSKKCLEGSDYENCFSEENSHINLHWKERYNDHMICIVNCWDFANQTTRFYNILKYWCEMAKECWQCRNEDAYDCFGLRIFNNNEKLYDVLNDENFIHFEDGEYKHDLMDDYSFQSADYLFSIIDKLKKEIEETAEATEKEATEKEATEKEATEKEATEKEATEKEATEVGSNFIDVIADKLLANAMDKVKAKIENCDNLFDDTIINSLVDKLFEKVSDRLNEKLGL